MPEFHGLGAVISTVVGQDFTTLFLGEYLERRYEMAHHYLPGFVAILDGTAGGIRSLITDV